MPKSDRHRRPASLRTFRERLRTYLYGDGPKFAALCFFIACVFAMGGGSRSDIQSLIVLRPLTFLFIAYAALAVRPDQLRAAFWPLLLVGLLAFVSVFQLLPLPPQAWTQLPGRELFARIAQDAGLPPTYRPLTLSPARTLNMALSLSVPLACILLIAIQEETRRRRVLGAFLIAGIVSALVATAQIAGLGGDALYLYRITNPDFPVGLMANRNHQALLMGIVLVLLAESARRAARSGKQTPLLTVGALVGALVVLALLLVSGSRAALLFAVIALAGAAILLLRSSPGPQVSIRNLGRKWWAAVTAMIVAALIGTMLLFSRAESINRMFANDALEDYRVERLPVLLDMLRDHWLAGIGFGAFEGAYRRYEAVHSLSPFILNQAHNDWLQFPIEGGLPALAVLVIASGIVLVRAKTVFVQTVRERPRTDFALLVILILIAVASVVDYPLRTPILMLVGSAAFTLLTWRRTARLGGG